MIESKRNVQKYKITSIRSKYLQDKKKRQMTLLIGAVFVLGTILLVSIYLKIKSYKKQEEILSLDSSNIQEEIQELQELADVDEIQDETEVVEVIDEVIDENLEDKIYNLEYLNSPEIYNKIYKDIDLNDWQLYLINSENRIDENFEVDIVNIGSGQSVDSRIKEDLEQMIKDSISQGVNIHISDSYRTEDRQRNLYNAKVNQYLALGYITIKAKEEASKWVAEPGCSEHQIGLALDLVDTSYRTLDKSQEQTKAQIWLLENSYKYGFILRYPEDKTSITKINYEPWHYRYVGKKYSHMIFNEKICLEEFITKAKMIQGR